MQKLLWLLFRLLDAAVVGAFVLGYLALYVRPGPWMWWLQMVAIGLPYFSLAAIITSLVVISRRRRSLWFRLPIFIAILIRFWPGWGGSVEPGDFRVLSYNIPRYWEKNDSLKAAALIDYARAVRPDVMAFQDVDALFELQRRDVRLSKHIAPLNDSLGYVSRFANGAQRDMHTPQPVLTKVPVTSTEYFYFYRDDANADYTFVTRIRFQWEGREAVLYNLHLRSYGMRKPWRDPAVQPLRPRTWGSYLRQYQHAHDYRAWEADSLRRMLDRETVPILVVGDFNSTPHNWVFGHIARGLQDSYRIAGRGWGATYHVNAPAVRIDFILASPEWKVVAARIPKLALSDHRPVEAVLRWRE